MKILIHGVLFGEPLPVETDAQRHAISIAKSLRQSWPQVRGIGWPGRDLKQALDRTYYILRKIGVTKKMLGVTAHGLRHEFCHDLMISRGLIPSIKGGTSAQMSKEDRVAVELHASRALGHSRPGITAAYAGSFHRKLPALPASRSVAPQSQSSFSSHSTSHSITYIPNHHHFKEA